MEQFETERLLWVPLTLEMLETIPRDRKKLAKLCNAHVPDDWPGKDYAEALPFFIEMRRQNPGTPLWDGMIVHKASNLLIGGMGFKGGPDEDGCVAVGYNIIPTYRNAGYATEMLRGLVTQVFQIPEVMAVTAECLVDNAASIRVLKKAGLQRLREKNGMYQWELRSSSPQV